MPVQCAARMHDLPDITRRSVGGVHLEESWGIVSDAQPGAHGPHMCRGGPQVVPWQVREQVVFNLVLQPAMEPVHPLWTAHIVGGHHLLPPQRTHSQEQPCTEKLHNASCSEKKPECCGWERIVVLLLVVVMRSSGPSDTEVLRLECLWQTLF